MYMLTEGHWWSDRVEQPNEILQRERLGGIALKRNQTYPGNTVSWRFDAPGAAEQVAILLPGAARDHFKVIGYNVGDQPLSATMTTWNVTAGRWHMTSAVEGGTTQAADLDLDRSASTRVSFAPHATTTLEFSLVRPGVPTEQRPDIGIGKDDVHLSGRALRLTVHGLGAVDAPAGIATVEDAGGRVLASTPIPQLSAPRDLLPRTTQVVLKLAKPLPAGASVRVRLADGTAEVTQLNNKVPLEN
jgi:hypothetical protein